MKRSAEIAAQIFTARDALARDTPEDLRVAYLLLDSAAETLMVRAVKKVSWYLMRPDAPWYVKKDEQVKVDFSDFTQKEREKAARGEGHVHWMFSKSQIGSIDRNFDDKLRFLVWDGDMPSPFVGVVSRLHEYRNEMYHREESRPNALRIVVHLYAWIIAEMLDRLRPGVTSYGSDADDYIRRTYKRMGMPTPALDDRLHFLSRGVDIQSDMAAALREALELDDVPELIADYMTDRTRRTHGRLAFVAEFMAEEKQTKFTEMDAVRMAYESWVDRNGNGAVQQSRLATRATIRKWDEWPDTTRSCSNPIEAFRSLAEFEAEFEDFERRVQELAFAVDGEINFRIDYAKGK